MQYNLMIDPVAMVLGVYLLFLNLIHRLVLRLGDDVSGIYILVDVLRAECAGHV